MSSGAELFARYAYPPNALGYCGPHGEGSGLALGATGAGTERIPELAPAFDGAWPYLELLATTLGATDPLDAHVVEAYWIGGPALERVEAPAFGSWLAERFDGQPGVDWRLVRSMIDAGALPHHSFHVLAVYPWLGLLRAGHEGRPLQVLDRCRIRWGTVVAVEEGAAVVRCRLLTWDGRSLALGEPVEECVETAFEGRISVPGLAPGDRVALHWGWLCGRLQAKQVEHLRAATRRHLELVSATAT